MTASKSSRAQGPRAQRQRGQDGGAAGRASGNGTGR